MTRSSARRRGRGSAGIRPVLGVLLVLCAGCGSEEPAPEPAAPPVERPIAEAEPEGFLPALEAWKEKRDQRLREEDSWLTLVGLHWLDVGDNACGTGEGLAVQFPAGTAAARVGTFRVQDDGVSLQVAPGVEVEAVSGEAERRVLSPGDWHPIAADDAETPDRLFSGELQFYLIHREGRVGVRVKHPASPLRTGFQGLDYYPPTEDYRVEAEFVPFDPPKKVPIATVIGTEVEMDSPGEVRFSLGGESLTLEPLASSGGRLWFIFKDRTNGNETYGAGRYLYADAPVDGKVTIDFNRAYNMPCAFTEFATCPLPPRSNWLAVRVEAGEKAFKGGPAH